jgi:hypothetical protein
LDLDADSNASASPFNPKDLPTRGRLVRDSGGKMERAMQLFLPSGPLPDSLSGGGNFSMHYRAFAILAVICLALSVGGCRSRANRNYEEVLMPLQTGSVLHRRVEVRADREKKSKKKKTEKPKAPKPEAEPSATPAPEEESTPPPDRFR